MLQRIVVVNVTKLDFVIKNYIKKLYLFILKNNYYKIIYYKSDGDFIHRFV